MNNNLVNNETLEDSDGLQLVINARKMEDNQLPIVDRWITDEGKVDHGMSH